MASVTFKRGTKAEIESTQIQDGQLLMETDQLNNNKIYLDLPNGTRVPVGGSGAWVGTKKEFEVAVEEGKIADGTQVIITDDYESGITASMTLYSNAQSGLVATNVQSAIDEVSAKIGQENISQVGNSVTGAINNLNSNLVEYSFSDWISVGQGVIYRYNKQLLEVIIENGTQNFGQWYTLANLPIKPSKTSHTLGWNYAGDVVVGITIITNGDVNVRTLGGNTTIGVTGHIICSR